MVVPHEYTKAQLKKVSISIVRFSPAVLRCEQCGETWQVKQKGLRLPKGYWKCPKGCNNKAGAGSVA
jgi:ribosomal protein L37AE/L43A